MFWKVIPGLLSKACESQCQSNISKEEREILLRRRAGFVEPAELLRYSGIYALEKHTIEKRLFAALLSGRSSGKEPVL